MSQMQFLRGDIYEALVARETMFGMLAGYLLMIVGLRSFMKSRSPYSLKLIMQVYNFVQIALNVYMIWGLCILPFLSETPNMFGINAKYTERLEYFVFIHYISKYLDYLDTMFIILRGKERQQLSFLHVYHHASIGMIWGALLNIGHGNGTAVMQIFFHSSP
jgi:elongation of very long chain fatty acids protein 4